MKVQQTHRLRKWDTPFAGARLSEEETRSVLSLPLFEGVDARSFPDNCPLNEIVANDCRIGRYGPGEAIVRKGEYGSSVFVVISGQARSLMTKSGQRAPAAARHLPGPLGALSRMLRGQGDEGGDRHRYSPAELTLARNDLFGVLGAVTRQPRAASVVAEEGGADVLEIHWPGVRELMHWSDRFRHVLEDHYRQWVLWDAIQGSRLFSRVPDEDLMQIAETAEYESYGDREWSHSFQKAARQGTAAELLSHEPVIAAQGHYLDGVLLVHSGTVRVSHGEDGIERTTGILSRREPIGLTEVLLTSEAGGELRYPSTYRAMGFADLIRIPTATIETHLLPYLSRNCRQSLRGDRGRKRSHPPRSLSEFLVDHRYSNGATAMAINTERCINCDDCVRACAAAHNGVARFKRRGRTHENLMVATACMHCFDPVCMTDCPTGAIHRDAQSGTVVIDEAGCIGCSACASACPYDNITMSELRDSSGAFLVDEEGVQLQNAQKCDLCIGHAAGPACERACPHDALIRVDLRDQIRLAEWLCARSYKTAC